MTEGRRKLQISDKWIGLIAQAIAAAGVIFSNQQTVKMEVAPLKLEQTIMNMKITGLAEKVGRLEKKMGD